MAAGITLPAQCGTVPGHGDPRLYPDQGANTLTREIAQETGAANLPGGALAAKTLGKCGAVLEGEADVVGLEVGEVTAARGPLALVQALDTRGRAEQAQGDGVPAFSGHEAPDVSLATH